MRVNQPLLAGGGYGRATVTDKVMNVGSKIVGYPGDTVLHIAARK